MQNGDEEVGSQGGYGRRNPDGVDFSEDDRRAEGKAPEKIREINGRRYAYGQPDAVDYTVPVRTAADYPALTKIFFCSPIPRPQRVRGIFSFAETPGLAPSEAENAGNPQPGTSRVFCRSHGRNLSPESVLPAIEFPA